VSDACPDQVIDGAAGLQRFPQPPPRGIERNDRPIPADHNQAIVERQGHVGRCDGAIERTGSAGPGAGGCGCSVLDQNVLAFIAAAAAVTAVTAATGMPFARAEQQHGDRHGGCKATELLECFSPTLLMASRTRGGLARLSSFHGRLLFLPWSVQSGW